MLLVHCISKPHTPSHPHRSRRESVPPPPNPAPGQYSVSDRLLHPSPSPLRSVFNSQTKRDGITRTSLVSHPFIHVQYLIFVVYYFSLYSLSIYLICCVNVRRVRGLLTTPPLPLSLRSLTSSSSFPTTSRSTTSASPLPPCPSLPSHPHQVTTLTHHMYTSFYVLCITPPPSPPSLPSPPSHITLCHYRVHPPHPHTGPGHYETQGSLVPADKKLAPDAVFKSAVPRWSGPAPTSGPASSSSSPAAAPGPGSYDPKYSRKQSYLYNVQHKWV